MKFKALVVAIALSIFGIQPVLAIAASAAVIDQGTGEAPEDGSVGIMDRQVAIQTFVPSTSGVFARLDVMLKRSSGERDALYVAVYSMGVDGKPDFSTSLALTIIDPHQVDLKAHWVTAVFAHPATLSANVMYAFAISSPTPWMTENDYSIGMAIWNTDPYVPGAGYVFQDSQTWYTNQSDYLFKTYVGDYAVPVPPTLPSLAGKVNLIGTYGSVSNSSGLVGVVGQDFQQGKWTYGDMPVDGKYQAGQVDCAKEWSFEQILCDPNPTANSATLLTQTSVDNGYTSERPCDSDTIECLQSTDSFIIIDLGEWSTFTTFEVFQMHGSDGNVTHVKLYKNTANTSVSPLQTDAGWVSVVDGPVENGIWQAPGTPLTNDAVTRFDFAKSSSRYILLEFMNDGSYGDGGYIEVAGVKLFGTRTPQVAPVVKPVEKTSAKPHYSTFLAPGKKSLSTVGLASLKAALKKVAPGTSVSCVAYSYLPSLKAVSYARTLGKNVCAALAASRSDLKLSVATTPSSKAPKAAKGSIWLPGSYRVDLFVTNR